MKKKILLALLSICMMLPAMRLNISAEEITNEIYQECLDSGYYKLNGEGKLVFTESGKKMSKSQNYILTAIDWSNLNLGISTYAQQGIDTGYTYKNETKVECKGISEYVYYSHSKAQSHINSIISYKKNFGYCKISESSITAFITFEFGRAIPNPLLQAISMIMWCFSRISEFLAAYLNIIQPAFNSAHSGEGIVVIWWQNMKIVQARPQGK